MGHDCFQPASVFGVLPGIMLKIDGVINEAYFQDIFLS
jgi:hypothetical protein